MIFLIISVVTENAKLRLGAAILTGAALTVEIEIEIKMLPNDAIEILPLVADKTIKDVSK